MTEKHEGPRILKLLWSASYLAQTEVTFRALLDFSVFAKKLLKHRRAFDLNQIQEGVY